MRVLVRCADWRECLCWIGKREMVPNSLLSMVGNPLTLPLVGGVALEPFQRRRFLPHEVFVCVVEKRDGGEGGGGH